MNPILKNAIDEMNTMLFLHSLFLSKIINYPVIEC